MPSTLTSPFYGSGRHDRAKVSANDRFEGVECGRRTRRPRAKVAFDAQLVERATDLRQRRIQRLQEPISGGCH
jgi:hypothetical protein